MTSRVDRIQNLFPPGGTLENFLTLFFTDFSKTSMAKLVDPNPKNQQGKAQAESTAGAAEKNAEQIKRLSAHGTVWHAVSAFAKDGKASPLHNRARNPIHCIPVWGCCVCMHCLFV